MNQRATVLIVDDDPDIVDTMRDILVEEGHTVLSAANGQQALEVARVSALDLVLLDLDMPIMDGRQFLERAKVEDCMRNVEVVVISGAPDAPPNSIEKPLRLTTLLGMLSRIRKPAT